MRGLVTYSAPHSFHLNDEGPGCSAASIFPMAFSQESLPFYAGAGSDEMDRLQSVSLFHHFPICAIWN